MVLKNSLFLAAFFISLTSIQAQVSRWTYMMPNTEEGISRKQMIDLYSKKHDYRNAELIAKFGMKDEPQCYYFADRYVQNAYLNEKASEVVEISDSLLISPFSDENTFIYNAWIHNYVNQERVAFSVLKQANSRFPESKTILKIGLNIAEDRKDKANFQYFQDKLLELDPNNYDVYYQLFKDAVALDNVDDGIIYGETAILSDPKNAENPKIKRTLINLYDKWLVSWKKSDKYTCFDHRPAKLKTVRSMDDFLLLQNTLVYNYDPVNAGDLETRLFDYKLKILKDCNWIGSWYTLFGSTTFPQEYDLYIKEYGGELLDVNNCLSKIELSNISKDEGN